MTIRLDYHPDLDHPPPSLPEWITAIRNAADTYELRRLSRDAAEQFSYVPEALEEINAAEFLRLQVLDPSYGQRCEPEDFEWSKESGGETEQTRIP